jgi:hypothetical protein
MQKEYPECTKNALELLSAGDMEGLAKIMKNDLQAAAEQFVDLRLP